MCNGERQYLNILRKILRSGVDRPNRTGVDSRALFDEEMRFNMNDGFPALTTKKLLFDSVKAELLWFISGSTNINDLKKLLPSCRIWDDNYRAWDPEGKLNGDCGRIYGAQWTKWTNRVFVSAHCEGTVWVPDEYVNKPINQLRNVIEKIKTDSYDRRHLVSAWNAAEIGKDKAALPPCHVMYYFFVADGQLSLSMVQRSCDMFLGVPFNIASYSLLLHMAAQATNLKPFEFAHHLLDAHIYHNHFDAVKTQLERKPLPFPKLWLNPNIKDINDFKMEDIKLIDYNSYKFIKAPMAV